MSLSSPAASLLLLFFYEEALSSDALILHRFEFPQTSNTHEEGIRCEFAESFSIFLQYVPAEANLEEDNMSNLIPPPSTEEFY